MGNVGSAKSESTKASSMNDILLRTSRRPKNKLKIIRRAVPPNLFVGIERKTITFRRVLNEEKSYVIETGPEGIELVEDEATGHWITTDGHHILIGGDGRWIDKEGRHVFIGAGVFRNNNVDDVSKVAAMFNQPEVAKFQSSIDPLSRQFEGLLVDHINQTAGVWQSSREPSFLIELHATSDYALSAFAAKLAQSAPEQQMAAATFAESKTGKGFAYELSGVKDAEHAVQTLMHNGFDGQSVLLNQGRVVLLDEDGSKGSGMRTAAQTLGLKFTSTPGDVKFIGEEDYGKVQEEYAFAVKSGRIPPMGHATEVFRGITTKEKEILEYSPDQPRDDHGRWDGGGGDENPPLAPTDDDPPEGYIRIYRGVNPERNKISANSDTHGNWYTTTYEDAVSYANWDDLGGTGELGPDRAILAVDVHLDKAFEFAQSGSRRQIRNKEELLNPDRPVEMLVDDETAHAAKVVEGDVGQGALGMPKVNPKKEAQRLSIADVNAIIAEKERSAHWTTISGHPMLIEDLFEDDNGPGNWVTINGHHVFIADKGVTTKQLFYDEATKKWNPERRAMHQAGAERVVAGKVAATGRKPIAIIMGGGTGVGKTTVSDALLAGDPNRAKINPDDMKGLSPEFEPWKATDPINAAGRVHFESKAITHLALAKTMARGLDFTYDSTTSANGGPALIKLLIKQGYDVRVMFVDIPLSEAISRADSRAKTSPNPIDRNRLVDHGIIKMSHVGSAEKFFIIKDIPGLTRVQLYDNTGKVPRLIYERIHGGPERILDNARYEQFRKKGQGLSEAAPRVFTRPGSLPDTRGRGRTGEVDRGRESEVGEVEGIQQELNEVSARLQDILTEAEQMSFGFGHWITLDGDHIFIKGPRPEPGAKAVPGDPAAAKVASKHAAIESHLKNTSITSAEALGEGINKSQKVLFSNGEMGIFKAAENEFHDFMGNGARDNIQPGQQTEREVGAWEVAKIVGLDEMVSPAIARDFGGQPGVMLSWQNGTVAKNVSDSVRYDGKEDLAKAAVFDYIIGNEDRHGGNWVVSHGGNLKLIDHGLAFPEGKYDPYSNQKMLDRAAYRLAGTSPHDYVQPYVKNTGAILTALGKLGLPQEAIAGVERRITQINAVDNFANLMRGEVPIANVRVPVPASGIKIGSGGAVGNTQFNAWGQPYHP